MNWQLTKSVLSLAMLSTFALTPVKSIADDVPTITWKQLGELWSTGTLTDSKGQVWDVLYLPGTEEIQKVSKDNFVRSFETIQDLGDKEFWNRRASQVRDGGRQAKNSVTRYWIKGIGDDYTQTRERSRQIDTGALGGGVSLALTWIGFGIDAAARTVTWPLGVAYGIGVKSVALPLITITGVPLKSAFQAVGGGVLLPGTMYVWHSGAWVSTSLLSLTISRHEPTKESWLIHLKSSVSPPSEPRPEMVINKEGFDSLVQGAALRALTKEQVEQDEQKVVALRRHENELTSNLEKQESYIAYQKLLDDAYRASKVSLSADVRDVPMDDVKMDELIGNFLKNLQVEATPARVAAIRKMVRDDLESMIKEMARIAAANSASEAAQSAEIPTAEDMK